MIDPSSSEEEGDEEQHGGHHESRSHSKKPSHSHSVSHHPPQHASSNPQHVHDSTSSLDVPATSSSLQRYFFSLMSGHRIIQKRDLRVREYLQLAVNYY